MTPLYRKITLRLVPYLMLLYFVAFLDRVNISFAALTMNRDLGISDSLYGFAAGVFFLSYCLCEVPANLVLQRVGARRWLAILLAVWGVISIGTAFVDGRAEYIAARTLLGVAEAGFFPGIIFYYTTWLPRNLRSRVLALFLLSLPLCNCIGSPVSSHILLLNGFHGLKGWQWLFILEGTPAVLLGAITWRVLADRPETARWLSLAEKVELAQELGCDDAAECAPVGRIASHVARDALAYLMLQTGIYGLNFWLPKILAAQGVAAADTGWWAAVPFGAGAVAMTGISRFKSHWWLGVTYGAAAAGFAWAAVAGTLLGFIGAFSLTTMAMYAALPLFWSASTGRMSSRAAGAAIATVNSIGVTGGFVGPYALGWLRDATRGESAGMWMMAAVLAVGAAVVLTGPVRRGVPSHPQ